MTISSGDFSGNFVLRVSGEMRIRGCEGGYESLVTLLRAQEHLPRRMILNLAELKLFDSLGAGALALVLVECGKREIELKVVFPGGVAGHVLKRLHIFDAWPTFPDEAAALGAAPGALAAG